jgi:hypothetical protein
MWYIIIFVILCVYLYFSNQKDDVKIESKYNATKNEHLDVDEKDIVLYEPAQSINGYRTYSSTCVGIKYKAPDGRSRHKYSQKLRKGDKLHLTRERDNIHDNNAVMVIHQGMHLGYIPKRYEWISRVMDEGKRIEAYFDKLLYNPDGQLNALSLEIRLLDNE